MSEGRRGEERGGKGGEGEQRREEGREEQRRGEGREGEQRRKEGRVETGHV